MFAGPNLDQTFSYLSSLLLGLPFDVVGSAQATPRLSEDKVKQCIDPKLKADYSPKAVAKVPLSPCH